MQPPGTPVRFLNPSGHSRTLVHWLKPSGYGHSAFASLQMVGSDPHQADGRALRTGRLHPNAA
jgi:hypothetical protein